MIDNIRPLLIVDLLRGALASMSAGRDSPAPTEGRVPAEERQIGACDLRLVPVRFPALPLVRFGLGQAFAPSFASDNLSKDPPGLAYDDSGALALLVLRLAEVVGLRRKIVVTGVGWCRRPRHLSTNRSGSGSTRRRTLDTLPESHQPVDDRPNDDNGDDKDDAHCPPGRDENSCHSLPAAQSPRP